MQKGKCYCCLAILLHAGRINDPSDPYSDPSDAGTIWTHDLEDCHQMHQGLWPCSQLERLVDGVQVMLTRQTLFYYKAMAWCVTGGHSESALVFK